MGDRPYLERPGLVRPFKQAAWQEDVFPLMRKCLCYRLPDLYDDQTMSAAQDTRILLFAFLLLLSGPGMAQEFDAFAEAQKRIDEEAAHPPPRLLLITEILELNQEVWSHLSRETSGDLGQASLRKRVAELEASGRAKLVDLSMVAGLSGSHFENRSYRFHIYPSEFDPPQLDEKEERIVPVSMATTECWDTGFSVSGEVHLNGSEVVFQISPEISALAENRQSSDDANHVPRPSFAVTRIDAGFGAALGESVLAGVITQQAEDENGQSDKVLIIFLRADAHFVVPPGEEKAKG